MPMASSPVRADVEGAALEDFGEFNKLVGFEDIWEFDERWSEV